MSRSGCVDGPGIDSSGEGGTDGSRCGGDGEGSRWWAGEATETEGKDIDVEAAAVFAEIERGVDGETSMV